MVLILKANCQSEASSISFKSVASTKENISLYLMFGELKNKTLNSTNKWEQLWKSYFRMRKEWRYFMHIFKMSLLWLVVWVLNLKVFLTHQRWIYFLSKELYIDKCIKTTSLMSTPWRNFTERELQVSIKCYKNGRLQKAQTSWNKNSRRYFKRQIDNISRPAQSYNNFSFTVLVM